MAPKVDERTQQAQIQELMCYIWDNYLQLYDNVDDIFLMGVGNAYLGVKLLLINRGMHIILYTMSSFSRIPQGYEC